MINKKDNRNVSLAPAGRLHGGVALAILLLLTATALHGCITTAVVATIAIIKSASSHTATVEVEKTPAEVYSAMLRIVDKTPDVKLDKRDDDKRRLKVSRGKNSADARAKLLDNGKTELTVTASAGEEDKDHEELALDIVKIVCDELGVQYKIVEKKKLFSSK